jgi:hypothetical protein
MCLIVCALFQVNPLILVVHALHCTDIFQLLPFFHKIIITAALSNVKSVASLLSYFKYDKQETATYLRAFNENKDEYAHFCMDVDKRTITFLANNADEKEMNNTLIDVSAGDDMGLALALLSQLDQPGKATAIFKLIYKHVKKRVNTDDLTVRLKSAKTGGYVVVSLIDYLDAITTAAQPRDDQLYSFHKYLEKFVHIPNCFVLNKNYQLRRKR